MTKTTASRRLLPGFLLALGLAGQAQAATPAVKTWPLSSLSPLGDDFSDLAPLGRDLASARVVGLGEQTHGAREEFQVKLRLLRYLHEQLGYDLLVLESGFFDVGRIAARVAQEPQASVDALAPGNVFYMYAKSAEGRELLQYLDAQRRLGRPLQLAGMDSQHSGELSLQELLPGLRAMLAARPEGRALVEGPAWADFERLSAGLLRMQRQAPAAAEQAAYFGQIEAVAAPLCGPATQPQQIEGAAWWCRVVHSLAAQAHSFWGGRADYQRDNAMGANAIWLVEQLYGGRHKAVLWGHTVHLARGFQRSPQHLQAGEVMHRHWGSAYRVVQFSSSAGELLDFASMQKLRVPVPAADSLERWLDARGQRPLLVRAETPLKPPTQPQFAFEYLVQGLETSQRPGRLGEHWDWLVYLPRISPVSMVR